MTEALQRPELFLGVLLGLGVLMLAVFLGGVFLVVWWHQRWEGKEHATTRAAVEGGASTSVRAIDRAAKIAADAARDFHTFTKEAAEIRGTLATHGRRLDELEGLARVWRPRPPGWTGPELEPVPGQEPTPLPPPTASTPEPEGTDPSQLRSEESGG